MERPYLALIFLLAAPLSGAAPPVWAEQESPASVHATTDAQGFYLFCHAPAARPLRGTDATTLSNDRGLFVLPELPYGVYVLEVRHLAYRAREIPVRVAGGVTQHLRVELTTQPVELEGLTVRVEPRRFYNDMDGLKRRMDQGFGEFLLRNDIERAGATILPELLIRMPGVRIVENGRALRIRGRECTPMVFMDGRRIRLDEELGLRELTTFDLEAVEFYKGTASIPAEFNYSNNLQVGCGALVLWTRRGR